MSTQQLTPLERPPPTSEIGRATGFELARPASRAPPTSRPRWSATAPSRPPAGTKAPSSSPTCACS